MTEAAPLPTSAASACNGYGDNQMVLVLFGLWCRAVKFKAPADWPESRKEKAYLASGLEQEKLQRSIARHAMLSEIGKSALIWIITREQNCQIDRANPVLPSEKFPEHRHLVLSIAKAHPELARLADVTHAEISGNSPHDRRELERA